MKRPSRTTIAATALMLLVAGGLLASGAGAASAAAQETCGVPKPADDFKPTVEFGLSDTKAGANPEVSILVQQEGGQQELGHVTLCVPAGFNLPPDKKIENGTELGSADLEIAAGPGCADAGPVTAPATFPDRPIFEQDRTDEQADSKVRAVWVVDLRPVTTIPLEVTGNKKKGFKLDGDIPANAFTCPPLTFDGVINATAGEVPIFKNPPAACPAKLKKGKKCGMPFGPGDYTFAAFFNTQESDATHLIEQAITVTP
jgi:hypothetical protein